MPTVLIMFKVMCAAGERRHFFFLLGMYRLNLGRDHYWRSLVYQLLLRAAHLLNLTNNRFF